MGMMMAKEKRVRMAERMLQIMLRTTNFLYGGTICGVYRKNLSFT